MRYERRVQTQSIPLALVILVEAVPPMKRVAPADVIAFGRRGRNRPSETATSPLAPYRLASAPGRHTLGQRSEALKVQSTRRSSVHQRFASAH
jgi:hypothetical protein